VTLLRADLATAQGQIVELKATVADLTGTRRPLAAGATAGDAAVADAASASPHTA
jgi:hypothetical protein